MLAAGVGAAELHPWPNAVVLGNLTVFKMSQIMSVHPVESSEHSVNITYTKSSGIKQKFNMGRF